MDTEISVQLQKVKIGKTAKPLTTKEIESFENVWVKTIQTKIQETLEFKDGAEKLNLQLDKTRRIYICKGRITGDYLIYIPSNTLMSEKLVAHGQLKTLHGRVSNTMGRGQRKILAKLCQLTKRVIHKYYGCKRFRAVACPAQAVGDLHHGRTSGSRQFQVVSIDFAGQLIYIKRGKPEGKAHILVYSCSLTREVYMDLMKDQSLEDFFIDVYI